MHHFLRLKCIQVKQDIKKIFNSILIVVCSLKQLECQKRNSNFKSKTVSLP